jgi:carotenoid cleavage dioxygenase-like enzyme
MSVGHWFDGDGAVCLLILLMEKLRPFIAMFRRVAIGKKVRTIGSIFGGYGMVFSPCLVATIWDIIQNVANASVIAFPDRLLAFGRRGLPHALVKPWKPRIRNLDGLESSVP